MNGPKKVLFEFAFKQNWDSEGHNRKPKLGIFTDLTSGTSQTNCAGKYFLGA